MAERRRLSQLVLAHLLAEEHFAHIVTWLEQTPGGPVGASVVGGR